MMQNANNVLDEFANRVLTTPPGVGLVAPWNGVQLGDDSQAAAAALVRLGLIGAGQRANGSIALYAGRNHVGNPMARLLNGWVVYAMAIAFMAVIWWLHGMHDHTANWAGAVVAFFGGGYFAFHGLHAWKFAHLFMLGLGRPGETTRLGISVFAGLVGLASAAGFASRIIG